jgi:hypothetical protein
MIAPLSVSNESGTAHVTQNESQVTQNEYRPLAIPRGCRARTVEEVLPLLDELARQAVEAAEPVIGGSADTTVWVVPTRDTAWQWATAAGVLADSPTRFRRVRGAKETIETIVAASKAAPVLTSLIRRGGRTSAPSTGSMTAFTEEEMCALWLTGIVTSLLACNRKVRIADLHVKGGKGAGSTVGEHDVLLLTDVLATTVLWCSNRPRWRFWRRPRSTPALAQWIVLGGSSELRGAGRCAYIPKSSKNGPSAENN